VSLLRRALSLLYFMAPAYAANMAPPLVKYWRGWNRPISRRWLGSHKTVIGFAAGVVSAVAAAFLQHSIAGVTSPASAGGSWVELGLRFGLGAMIGDAVKSFFKRRLQIPPGRPWIPFDQLDFVAGALIFVAPRSILTPGDVAIVLALSFAGHIGVNHAACWLGIRDTKW
jgi:CDP-2,3-bis-(O-geranylgeranyl)-sn-glycerol synthase